MSQDKKQIVATIKLRLVPGAAKLPEVASILGQKGVPGKTFIDRFNTDTANIKATPNTKYNVKVIVYNDKSFEIICMSKPNVSDVIRQATGWKTIKSTDSGRLTITQDTIKKIAKEKMPDLYVRTEEAAIRTIEGTLRSMAVNIEG